MPLSSIFNLSAPMTCSDIIMILIALLSIFVSLKAIHLSNKTSMTQNELQSYQAISAAKQNHMNLRLQNNIDPEIYEILYDVTIEEVNNAYDIFCGKYLAGEIDKKRFLNDYSGEIINWVEHFPLLFYQDTDFKNILNAYRWLKFYAKPSQNQMTEQFYEKQHAISAHTKELTSELSILHQEFYALNNQLSALKKEMTPKTTIDNMEEINVWIISS